MMCGAGKFGRTGGKIAARQSGILAGRVGINITIVPGLTIIEALRLFFIVDFKG